MEACSPLAPDLDAGLRDAALACAGVPDHDKGVLPSAGQGSLGLLGTGVQAQLVQVDQPGRRVGSTVVRRTTILKSVGGQQLKV